ncbi:acylphosphatase-1-like isoform X1 [Diorhabda sublineata]|uniref:acylphosphatase-1-like isoform X1 n=2 Tax=Diorhabda sublineata TaxID=1163346 RepID=UPI0024E05792|nr:acylphosphatase-1-like isoform X1 [Diorhabda sublineata]XP_056646576.1 acylphosphatase-1-like isoform X1 [Diorhabda sublineata]XP_056646577.1 acylphosphatase-1-like isoform X1 [Diorhabda sublineata]
MQSAMEPTRKMSRKRLMSVDFEVFGKVQGPYFKKYTAQVAYSLHLKGWCMNSDRNTLKGVVEGRVSDVESMKNWLKKNDRPQSKIDAAIFSEEKEVDFISYDGFRILI